MQKDPRFLNKTFSQESIKSYLTDYASSLNEALQHVPSEAIDAACQMLMQARLEGGRIFVAGNGGSAAISEHLSCDWQKGVHVHGQGNMKVHCLTSNSALLTAISNDYGYDKSFAFQLELADLEKRDLVLLISSSGNSENIMQALRFAKEKGCKVIGLSGFSGGKLNKESDVSLHIPFENYGLVEDAHQVIMHVLAQFHDLSFRKRI
ncbi:MAG: SIS domain-containing protein [Bdellovibrionales bacterium]